MSKSTGFVVLSMEFSSFNHMHIRVYYCIRGVFFWKRIGGVIGIPSLADLGLLLN